MKMKNVPKSYFRKMKPFLEAALAADWKWGCGGRSPPPGARTKFGTGEGALESPSGNISEERDNKMGSLG